MAEDRRSPDRPDAARDEPSGRAGAPPNQSGRDHRVDAAIEAVIAANTGLLKRLEDT
ncbi:hypothetical protein [Arthrobacter sp. KK5.5]|uniref:hypothetical protein n=1 Tax=Arthrobacter sp. KK5.5 TaxID=3373084 RepID=UPI003EE5EF74